MQFLPVRPVSRRVTTTLALSEDGDVFKATRAIRPRRIKSFMKQVVGGTFSGFHNEELEHAIVLELAQCHYESMKSSAFNQKKIRLSTQRILTKIKALLQDRLRVYTNAIVNRLFNPEVALGA
jgi:hypothetical protein